MQAKEFRESDLTCVVQGSYIKEGITASIIRCDGMANTRSCTALDNALAYVAEQRDHAVMDYRKLTHMRSAGVGSVLGGVMRIKKATGEQDPAIIQIAASERIKEIFDLFGLSCFIPSYESIDQAIAQIKRQAQKVGDSTTLRILEAVREYF